MIKVAVVGAGLIGKERIEALKYLNNDVMISSVYDINKETLLNIKNKYNVNISSSLEDLLSLKPNWIFIATHNDVVKDIVRKAFNINSNVCIEKPFGRTLEECQELIKLKPANCKFNIGFNYRFFDGVEKALYDVKNEKFGKLISVNLILGHGNQPGAEKLWRFQPNSGGDCITDLGVHLFDLILQISKINVNIKYAKSWTGFWNTGIEEEAHFIAENDDGVIFNGQVSLNRWKSIFKLEINGTEGYGIVNGRGGNYGAQTYTTGIKWGWRSGKAQIETEILEIVSDCKNSFIKETASILGLSNNLSASCDHIQGENVMKLLKNINNIK